MCGGETLRKDLTWAVVGRLVSKTELVVRTAIKLLLYVKKTLIILANVTYHNMC